MARRVYIARPRLDCSFKPGPVPEVEGPPQNKVLALFGAALDGVAEHHRRAGDTVTVVTEPLWRFELEALQRAGREHDVVYFPHRQRDQFPIGDNAVYYKNAAFPEWLTLDRVGWGPTMSWLPVTPVADAAAWRLFRSLQQRIATNESLFAQPAQGDLGVSDYSLFICQIPHDEAITLHSDVRVEAALQATLAYCEARGRTLVVKGHPASPKAMAPLKALAQASRAAVWVEEASVHTCLAGADRVFLVNSGVGFEAMLHDKTIIRFGRSEYAPVTPQATPDLDSLIALEAYSHRLDDYVGLIGAFLSRCARYDDPRSIARAVSLALDGV